MPASAIEDLPVFDAFEKVSDPSIFTPLPDDWQVGAADIVKSTAALRAGRYKDVNMAGAAVVGAVAECARQRLISLCVRRRRRGACRAGGYRSGGASGHGRYRQILSRRS